MIPPPGAPYVNCLPKHNDVVYMNKSLVSLSFIQHGSFEIVCLPNITLLVDLTPALKASNYFTQGHLRQIGSKPIGIHEGVGYNIGWHLFFKNKIIIKLQLVKDGIYT